jgi:hypothetical protein
LAPHPPDFHQHIVSDCGGSRHFRAADFIAAEISHGAIGKKSSPQISPAVARQNIEIPHDLVAEAHTPEGACATDYQP